MKMNERLHDNAGSIKWLAVLLLIISRLAASAQSQVTVSFVLRPPYSSYVKDYAHLENKSVITLTNLTGNVKQVYLKGSITNISDGLYVRSGANYRPASFITLQPHQTTVITADPTATSFLDANNTETNITDPDKRNMIRIAQLPEGIYHVCVQVYDYYSGAQLSDPNAGCTTVNITLAGPPNITNPINEQTIAAGASGNIVYTWTPPTGNLMGGRVLYDLVVVKVWPGQNPNDVVNAARDYSAGNPIVRRGGLVSQVYAAQPSDLKPEPGSTYAMQVVARDANNVLSFKNDGKSEVVVFAVDSSHTPSVISHYTPASGATKNTHISPPPPPPPPPSSYSQTTYSILFTFSDVTGTLKYYFNSAGTGGAMPLGNMPVQLVLAKQMINPSGNVDHLLPNNVLPGQYTVLATGNTDVSGKFAFNVPNFSTIDFSDQPASSFSIGPASGVEWSLSVTGQYRQVLMVIVNNEYYCQPDDVRANVKEFSDIGTVYSKVKDYQLTVHVQDNEPTPAAMQGLDVFVLRSFSPVAIPPDEGSPGNTTHTKMTVQGETFDVIATGSTGPDGNFVAQNLPLFDLADPFDRYFIYARVQADNTTYSIKEVSPQTAAYESVKNGLDLTADVAATTLGNSVSSGQYTPANCLNTITTQQDWPRIYGRVTNPFASVSGTTNSGGEGNVSLMMFSVPGENTIALMNKYGPKWSAALNNDPNCFLTLATSGHIEQQLVTGNDGRFDFNQLQIEKFWGAGKPIGYYRFLYAVKSGFFDAKTPIDQVPLSSDHQGDMAILDMGQAYNANEVPMTPNSSIILRLVDEDSNAVTAHVYYIDQKVNQVGQAFPSDPSTGKCLVFAPSGKVRFVIQPDNADNYMIDTVWENVPVQLSGSPTTVVIPYNLNRIRINVYDNKTKSRISGAKIKLLGTNAKMYSEESQVTAWEVFMGGARAQVDPKDPYQKIVDDNGGADFAFKDAGSAFTFLVQGPDDKDYIVTAKQVSSNISKNWAYVNVYLEPGRRITGTVMLGKVPVSGARVWLDRSTSPDLPEIDTFSDGSGKFCLRHVPLLPRNGTLTFRATKQGYVGDYVTDGAISGFFQDNFGGKKGEVVVVHSYIINDTVQFNLSTFDGIDLTQLLGFPMEVTALNVIDSAKKIVSISCIIPKIYDNEVFKVVTGKYLHFNSIKVGPDVQKDTRGNPYARPLTLPLVTDQPDLDIEVFGYHGRMHRDAGIVLDTFKTHGVLKGGVTVYASSFQSPSFGLPQGTDINITDAVQPAQAIADPEQIGKKTGGSKVSLMICAFAGQGTSLYKKDKIFGVCGPNGDALEYSLFGFDATADPSSSTLTTGELTLQTKIRASPQNAGALTIPIGNVGITETKILSLTSLTPFQLQLGKFTLKADKLQLNNSGLQFSGKLLAAGMQIPYTNAVLQPTNFSLGDNTLQLSNAKILGVVPVNVTGKGSLGYDPSAGAWFVKMGSGSISGLDGFASGDAISFSSLYLYSDGTTKCALNNGPSTHRIYNVADLSIQTILFYDSTSFMVAGTLDLGIPGLKQYNTSLGYSVKGQQLSAAKLGGFLIDPFQVNGVSVSVDSNSSSAVSFGPGTLTIHGKVSDKDPTVFKNLKYSITKDASNNIELDLLPSQSMPLGGDNGKLTVNNLQGKMNVRPDKTWNHLYIEGDMPESMGFDPAHKHMRFDVLGDLQVSNQTLALQNITTPFGDINMQYDIPNKRLTGSMHMENDVTSGVHISGSANIVFDPDGYYFLAGANLSMTNPAISGAAAMLIGNYPKKDKTMVNIFQQNSSFYAHFKRLPDGFTNAQGINGFFFEGSGSMPVPVIPNANVDLILVHADLSTTFGGDVRLGADFGSAASGTKSYNMGYSIFADAKFALGASAIVACFGTSVSADADVSLDGTYFSNGNWDIDANAQFKLGGSVWYGAGLYCDANCNGLCVADSATAALVVTASGTLSNTAGNNVTLSVSGK